MTAPVKPAPTAFLGGAKSRLLPFAIPFAFFGGAVAFHAAFWVGVVWVADEIPHFVAGPGRVLAVMHLLTFGVLAATAFGAAFQLLPVATRAPLAAEWPARLVAAMLLPGTALFAAGLAETVPALALSGGGLVAGAGLVAAALLAHNLARARGMPGVVAHGWAAVASLAGLAALGLALAVDQHHPFLAGRTGFGAAHAILAVFGFMGMLALGFSYVLVPMFGLAPPPAPRAVLEGFGVAAAALAVGVVGAVTAAPVLVALGAATGILAVGLHLRLMAQTLEKRMRRRLGPSFLLVRAAWACLPAALLLGGLTALELWPWRGPALFGAVALVGWLLTFLLGMLQRIVPFLAAMHAPPGRLASPPSAAGDARALALHRACHAAAFLGLVAGIVGDWPWAIRAAGAVGALGAGAFAWFFVAAVARARGTAPPPAPAAPAP